MDQGRSYRSQYYQGIGKILFLIVFVLFFSLLITELSAQGSPFFNGNREPGPAENIARSGQPEKTNDPIRIFPEEQKNPEVKKIPDNKTPIPPRDSENKNSPGKGNRGFLGALFSVVGSLCLVIALFLGVIWFLKKFAPQQKALISPDLLQCVGQYPLTPKIRLYLLLFGSRLILISSTGDSVEVVAEIDDPREIKAMIQSSPSSFNGISTDLIQEKFSKNERNHSEKRESEDRFRG